MSADNNNAGNNAVEQAVQTSESSSAAPAQAQAQAAQQDSQGLPPEDTRTALKADDRTVVVDLRTGEKVLEPVARDRKNNSLILLCLDPTKKGTEQSIAAIRVAKKLVRDGDIVIMMSVLPLHVVGDAPFAVLGSEYDVAYQVETLKEMRKQRIEELSKLAKEFPDGVELYARLVHGGAARQILIAAEETNCSLIIIGKRKLSTWQKLVSSSVSGWIISRAPCDILVAK